MKKKGYISHDEENCGKEAMWHNWVHYNATDIVDANPTKELTEGASRRLSVCLAIPA
jgi:hypothetical protein